MIDDICNVINGIGDVVNLTGDVVDWIAGLVDWTGDLLDWTRVIVSEVKDLELRNSRSSRSFVVFVTQTDSTVCQ